ncbi:MAG: lipoyl(octanoyl) transferase LipB [Nesterenkonia sp.]|uniref:lipoyl(octanoyl) transferase LipB n=1 Tax=Nesterenkonia marinintestina TaxID=2979865 RepID=UPI0021C0A36E|nr:lipoyl(octanoyl) transferase LipB [Nesterenkonia sp. GX14115]MDO5492462.1 lipoyl(octanoyl) transferase LipB [Nesterenkonia sp.]
MSLAFRRLGFDPEFVDYADALQVQRSLHADVEAGRSPSTVLLLEHEPTYTAGRRTEPQDMPQDGTPVISVDRGGKITWHGPGQLVGYPILHLADPALVKDYVAVLEHRLIHVLRRDYGIESTTVEGRSGVWITDGPRPRKIAAVGLRVHHGVTMHGFALNCSNDLRAFDTIIPCGITDAATTSVSAEIGRTVTPGDVAPAITAELRDHLPRLLRSAADVAASRRETASPIDTEGALK